MAKVSNELITRFAFEGSIAPLQQFNLSMVGSLKNLGLLAGAFAGMAGAIGKWVTDISASQDATGQLSRSIGVSVEALGELGYAASQNGSSVDKMRDSLSNLSEKIGEASIRGSEEFSRLGISVRDASGKVKSADKVFMEFAARSKQLGLSQQQIQSFAQKLGIDRSLVQLLGKTSEEINGLRQRAIALGRVTTEQSDNMLAYNDSINTLNRAFDGVKVKVAVSLIPQLKELAETMTNNLVNAADAIADTMKILGELFGAVIKSLMRMAPVLTLVAAGFVALKIATMGWAAALNILKRVAVVAAILALYLVVDDLMTAFQGGQSIIADFYSNLTGGRSIVQDLTRAFEVLGPLLGVVAGAFVAAKVGVIALNFALNANPIAKVVTAFALAATLIYANWEPIKEFFVSLWGGIVSATDTSIGAISNLINSIGAVFSNVAQSVLGAWTPIKEFFVSLWGGIVSATDTSIGAISNLINSIGAVFSNVAQSVLGAWTPIKEFFSSLFETIKGVASSIAGMAGGAFKFIGNLVGGGGDTPQPQTQQMMQPTQTSSSRTSNVNQEVKIEVRSDNPEAAGKAVKTALDQQLTDAQLQNGAVAR